MIFPQHDANMAVGQLREATRKFVAVNDAAIGNTHGSTTALKNIAQRLAQEKIFLSAAVANAEQNAAESASKVPILCLFLFNI